MKMCPDLWGLGQAGTCRVKLILSPSNPPSPEHTALPVSATHTPSPDICLGQPRLYRKHGRVTPGREIDLSSSSVAQEIDTLKLEPAGKMGKQDRG